MKCISGDFFFNTLLETPQTLATVEGIINQTSTTHCDILPLTTTTSLHVSTCLLNSIFGYISKRFSDNKTNYLSACVIG